MKKEIDSNLMQRLAFVKYLYQEAMEQSKKPKIAAGASVLMFHDAVELLVYLAFSTRFDKKEPQEFMGYWAVEGLDLPMYHEMKKLNNVRRELKHRGTIAAQLEIESIRVNTTDFLNQVFQSHFQISLNKVSLISFVEPKECRERLERAKEQINDFKIQDAAKEIAIAFKELLVWNLNSYQVSDFGSPFQHATQPPSIGRSEVTDGRRICSDCVSLSDYIANLVEKLDASFQQVDHTISVLATGMDYKKFKYCQRFLPLVDQTSSGQWRARFVGNESSCTDTYLETCIEFIVNESLRLRSSDNS
jgi:hypothetical protein